MIFPVASFWVIFIKTVALPAAMGIRKAILKKMEKNEKSC